MTTSTPLTNGRAQPNGQDDEARMLEAIAAAHPLPGYYPIVVIARTSDQFAAALDAWAATTQDGAPYRITSRSSRKGNYVSYRVELYVNSALEAVTRKASLADLEGVIVVI